MQTTVDVDAVALRSGNPGYLEGEPLVAGLLTTRRELSGEERFLFYDVVTTPCLLMILLFYNC